MPTISLTDAELAAVAAAIRRAVEQASVVISVTDMGSVLKYL
jgi:hypothetical protein